MILDGMNMLPNQQRGHEKITRQIRTRLIVVRAILLPINAISYSLSAYFMNKNLVANQTLITIIPHLLLLPQLVYFAYISRSKGRKIIEILSATVDMRKQVDATSNVLQRRDFEGIKMMKTSTVLISLIPKLFYILIAASLEVLGEAVWACYAQIINAGGVSWISFLVLSRILIVVVFGYGGSVWLSTYIHEDTSTDVRIVPRVFRESLFQVKGQLWLENGLFDDAEDFL